MFDIAYSDLLNFYYVNDVDLDKNHYYYKLRVFPAREWWNFIIYCHGSITLDDEV